ncbi:hypothetical protein KBF38_06830 [bacterium]|nr:hypothetical protein [bacterium]
MLAIAFAGNMLTAQPVALCREAHPPSASAIEAIEKNAQAAPETKAYCLLQLAYCYITGGDATSLEKELKTSGLANSRALSRRMGRHGLSVILWASSVSLMSHSETVKHEIIKKEISSEDRAVADKAIVAAMEQLGHGYSDPQALHLYLIASGLSRMTGNAKNEQNCTKILNDAIQAREANKTLDVTQVKVVASILDSMAYGLVPIRIPDYQGQTTEKARTIDMKNFDESERLKLRAAALLDCLPNTDQERRKAHRDLALWYLQLGKGDKSLKEKKELFKLVGVKDDKILYPQPATCGHPLWWSLEKVAVYAKCGMG